jgi:hypothetical protein
MDTLFSDLLVEGIWNGVQAEVGTIAQYTVENMVNDNIQKAYKFFCSTLPEFHRIYPDSGRIPNLIEENARELGFH